MCRANRAANFAIGFAVHRMDHDAAVIQEAALLHDFAEMMVWIHAPGLALEVAQRQAAQPDMRSADAQRSVLHVTYAELQQGLMHRWHLPELLVRISDDHLAATSPQVRNVVLAVRVARHSALGWDNTALPDDLDELGALLSLSTPHVQQLLADIER